MEPPAATAASAALAETMPTEIIESILILTPVPDLIIAAANLPSRWRAVLEASKPLQKHIVNFLAVKDRTPYSIPHTDGWMFTCPGAPDGGHLLVHRRPNGDEGFMVIPKFRKSSMIVLDPTTKTMAWSRFAESWRNCGEISLNDMRGRRVLRQTFDGTRGPKMLGLQSYVHAFGAQAKVWIAGPENVSWPRVGSERSPARSLRDASLTTSKLRDTS